LLPSKLEVLLILFSLFLPSFAYASTYLKLDDDAYILLERLEAEGVIKSSLLTTKPLSYKEVGRLVKEAEENSKGRSPYIRAIVNYLKSRFSDELKDIKFIKPAETVYLKYHYQDSLSQLLNYNNDGDTFKRGANLRVGFGTRIELKGISFYLNPEGRSSEDNDALLKWGYGIWSVKGIDLQIGKDSKWWGPCYHGALLVSNNAEPFTMISLTNPEPVLLPWVFKYLGPFRFNLFVTRLEKKREIPKPYLWGMRLNFKPLPYIEIGLQRTAILGGKGRSENLNTWFKSFTGKGENEPGIEAGDQKGGGDIKITIPWKIQPFQVYLEAAGEDEAGGLPSNWAYIFGVYLPRIGNIEELSLRVEYAKTTEVWYRHHIYKDGYTYKNRIIGHYMGTDGEDLYTEITYHLPELGIFSIFYDKWRNIEYNKIKEVGLKANIRVKDAIQLGLRYSYGRVSGSSKKDINLLSIILSYNF